MYCCITIIGSSLILLLLPKWLKSVLQLIDLPRFRSSNNTATRFYYSRSYMELLPQYYSTTTVMTAAASPHTHTHASLWPVRPAVFNQVRCCPTTTRSVQWPSVRPSVPRHLQTGAEPQLQRSPLRWTCRVKLPAFNRDKTGSDRKSPSK